MLQEQLMLPEGAIIQDQYGERYIVEDIVGKGGFSAVYLVRDGRSKQKTFALKEIINPDNRERRQVTFEAELLKRLTHRSLPHVYQVFENNRLNRIYMLMDYVDGKNLETLRREQPEQRFSLALTLALLTPIVEAVIYLHKQGTPVVHRDIKPSNIIIPMGIGDAVLVDFGLAKEYVQDKTTNVFRYGTPGYAALEQYGQGTDLRTDIYALGATFYTLLTGNIPVDALTRTIDQHVRDPLPPAHEVNPKIPLRVSHVIVKAMSLRSENRYSSVEHFWQALSIAAMQAETNSTIHSTPGLSSSSLPQLSPQDIQILATTRMHVVQHKNAPRTRVRHLSYPDYKTSRRSNAKVVVIALMTLILLGVIADGFFFVTFNHRVEPVVKGVPTSIHKIQTRAVPTISANPYPTLASDYEGTIYDSGIGSAHQAQPMYLNNIQQKQDSIKGSLRGLGLTLPFSGKVTKDQKISFQVFIAQTGVTLTFMGNIKVGGDIAGGFQSKGPDGQNVQEFGLWNLRQEIATQPLLQQD